MGISEDLVQIKSEADALLAFANQKTGAGDTRLGDAVKTLADGFGAGGGGGVQFTEVSSVPAGRSFSINTDYDRVIIALRMENSTSYRGGIGYNGQVKNVGLVDWFVGSDGISLIYIDNVNLFGITVCIKAKSETTPSANSKFVLTERAKSIQPHWTPSASCTGGYYTIPLS